MSGLSRVPPSGYVVREATPYELFVDLDTEAQRQQFRDHLTAIRAHLSITTIHFLRSRSGNTHVILTMSEPMSLDRRLAYAGILGSDPLHIYYALEDGRWVFFRPEGGDLNTIPDEDEVPF